MKNFEDTFETRKQSFISAFSICMTTFKDRNFVVGNYDKNLCKYQRCLFRTRSDI